jgi:hypothetical protein
MINLRLATRLSSNENIISEESNCGTVLEDSTNGTGTIVQYRKEVSTQTVNLRCDIFIST